MLLLQKHKSPFTIFIGILYVSYEKLKNIIKEIHFKCNVSIISPSSFPNKTLDHVRHMEWWRNCRRKEPPSPRSLICSTHFAAVHLDKTGQTVRLRPGAIPTIFELPQHLTVSIPILSMYY